MTDWIDNEKASEAAQAENQRIRSELRLHNAKLLYAIAPGFWTACLECLRATCDKLRLVFPNDLRKQCSLGNEGDVWRLQGCKLPWRVLQMRLNLAGQTVEVYEERRESRDRISPVGPDQITMKINDEDGIEFHFRGARHLTPDSLAETLAKYVRG